MPDEGYDGTRRESQGHVGTRREGTGPPVFVRGLPAELASRFTVVQELPASGAEADVVLVDERTSGLRRVLKLYRRGVALDEEAVSRLALAEHAHVVEVIDRGWAGGCWFEVLEYCEFGSLRDLLDGGYVPATDELVSEVATALIQVHGLGLVHRDLKPENLLVRTVEPLDLVLGDFGPFVRLTRRCAGPGPGAPPSTRRQSSRAARCRPPGTGGRLGMIVAELAVGRHPFELPDGTMINELQIHAAVAQRPVDLTDVSDPRTRLLCQGLLTRDRHHRWGAAQVKGWLDGETPDGGGRPGSAADGESTPGALCRHRARLARRAGPLVPTTLGRGAAPPLPRA